MNPKVLFLDHTGVLGGAELFLLKLAGRWRGERKVVLFEAGPLSGRLERDAVPVEILAKEESVQSIGRGGRGLAQLRAVPALWRLARQVARRAADFDVLFANSQKSLVVGALAARLSRKPLIWYLHDILTADQFSGLNRKVAVTLGNQCAIHVIANSEASREAFIHCGGKAARTTVVYNGIDDPADPKPETESAVREIRTGLGWNGKTVVGLFSRLAPWKGQHVLLDALAQVPGLHALFVGAPLFSGDTLYQQELEAKVTALGVGDRVRFLGFRDDIPALLQAVDLVAHTSVSPEPFGRVIVEGMLAGKPVVAARAGGACEIVEDGVTGRLVTPGDADALATALREMIDHPDEAKRLGRAGQAAAQRRFSVEAMLLGIERVVAEAASAR